ncbi:MAG TPA: hypothetical protein VFA77_03580, partial [Candidatus Eisenbacteria bacterium]|nr:hypothetical protein [Candidatus Eisenbacteria bacterium]
MKSNSVANSTKLVDMKNLFWIVLSLLSILAVLFFPSFKSGQVLFSNDAPLGILNAKWFELPESFLGCWVDVNLLGISAGSNLVDVTYGLGWLLSPVGYSKFYTPLSLLLLGLSAWLFCRQAGFHPIVGVLVGLAAALNGNYFSNACWGLASRALTLATTFLALAALVSNPTRHRFLKIILAGLAVGFGVMEGADNGAIFSLYVAAFVVFQAWATEGTKLAALGKGIMRVGLVAVFAGLMGAQTITSLVGTQIKGVVGTQQDEKSKEERWDFATQWSLPKAETLRVIIPGLYGYRMDTPDGGNYCGRVGQQPGWETHHQGMARHSGSGEYAGVLVVLVACWAAAQSLRRKGNIF